MEAELDLLLTELGASSWTEVASATVLVLARTAPLTVLCPWLLPAVPSWIRASAALVLCAALLPSALASAKEIPSSALLLSLLGTREVLVGILFALASSLPLLALGWAGRLIDLWRGALLSDCSASTEQTLASPLEQLYRSAGAALFVLLAGHLMALGAFADSFGALPLGATQSTLSLDSVALDLTKLVGAALAFATRLAAPVAVALLGVDVCAAILSRAVEGFAAHFVLLPLRAGAGLAVAFLGITLTFDAFSEVIDDGIRVATKLLGGLTGD